jgi:hypothetical protein
MNKFVKIGFSEEWNIALIGVEDVEEVRRLRDQYQAFVPYEDRSVQSFLDYLTQYEVVYIKYPLEEIFLHE